MTRFRLSAGIVLAGLLTSISPALAADLQTINLRATDELIIPGYRALRDATGHFEATAADGCTDRGALKAAYQAVGDAWSDVELWRFGPIQYLERRDRIWYWPDKHSRLGRQLRRFLSAADPEWLDDEKFFDLSAALEGMPAAELLLYGKHADQLVAAGDTETYTCGYLRAITRNLHSIATHVVTDWSDPEGGERRLVAEIANGGSELYESPGEYTTELLKSLHTELVAIRDLKFDRPLGKNIDKARPKRAEFWRSDRPLRNIRRNLASLRALFDLMSTAITDDTLRTTIETDFDEAERALAAISVPLTDAVSDDGHRSKVGAARAAIHGLAERVGRELPAALDLTLGFNSLDGD